ncbi:MAG: restriction endonuclease subunit S [Candidatus Wallbacteria bacterium]|nr:restriction endonuclease subunit S [Candidatus Wallbacteria bacterium]
MEVRPGYKLTEVGVIPEEWNVVSISSVAAFTSGQGINVATLAEERSHDCPIPVYGGNGIAGYTSATLTNEPTVVVGRVGQRCGEVHLTEGPAWITDNALYPRRFLKKPDVRYLALAMQATGLNGVRNRNDLPLITQSILHSVRFPLPPTEAEQRAIAAALSDVDALLDGLGRLIAKKRDIKQAATQQLLTGAIRLPGFHGEWEPVEFGDVACIRNTKVVASATSAGTLCVELEFIDQGSGRLLSSAGATVSSSRYSFMIGDVLFGRLRAYLRKYWLATFSGVCSTEIWPLIAREERLTCGFLHLLVQTTEFMNAAGVSYGTHMPRSDWSVLRKLFVRLPPLPEQSAIAAILSDMDAELAALEARRDKTRALKQAMMQELLTGRTRLV